MTKCNMGILACSMTGRSGAHCPAACCRPYPFFDAARVAGSRAKSLAQPRDFDAGKCRGLFFYIGRIEEIRDGEVVIKIDSASSRSL